MDLAFPGALVLMGQLSALITGQVAGDGALGLAQGAQLLAIYLVLALSYFFLPVSSAPHCKRSNPSRTRCERPMTKGFMREASGPGAR